jgi:hypothetical protein
MDPEAGHRDGQQEDQKQRKNECLPGFHARPPQFPVKYTELNA